MILFFILISTLHLIADHPLLDPQSNTKYVWYIIDFILTTIFVIEALIKIAALGLIFNGKDSYFRDPWNILDFMVVLVSVSITFNCNRLFPCSLMVRICRASRYSEC